MFHSPYINNEISSRLERNPKNNFIKFRDYDDVQKVHKFYNFFSTIHTRIIIVVKVNCTLVQTLRLCTGRTAYRGSRGLALPFLDYDTRKG